MMASLSDFTTRGRAIALRDGSVIFQPSQTSYELELSPADGKFDGALDVNIDVLIRCASRKLWTVPSGGNFIAPIFGSPRTIQGRVRHVEQNTIVIQAGAMFLVELPAPDSGLDLGNGVIGVGSLVNSIIFPGATMEYQTASLARA